MSVNIGWWNTSLSPPLASKQESTCQEKLEAACQYIEKVVEGFHIDVLFLSEVSQADIVYISEHLPSVDYLVKDTFDRSGKIIFGTCIIYLNSSVEDFSDEAENIISQKSSGKNLRCGQKVSVKLSEIGDVVFFFCHWPSRINNPEGSANRDKYARTIREQINMVFDTSGDSTRIVVLGDFNDEPFNESLAEHLESTRDRSVVINHRGMLYNPFWRKMGHRSPMTLDGIPSCPAGTYFHSSGAETKWHTFDQILVSSTFLVGDVKLVEDHCRVIDIREMEGLDRFKKLKFDHLPIVARFGAHNA